MQEPSWTDATADEIEAFVKHVEAQTEIPVGLRRRLLSQNLSDEHRGRVMLALGKHARLKARWVSSARWLRRAEKCFQACGYGLGHAWIANVRGAIAAETGKPALARKAYQRALLAFRELGDRRGEAAATFNLGLLQAKSGAGLSSFEAAEALFEAAGDRLGVAICKLNIGNAHRDAGRRPEALALYLQARQMFEALGEANRAARCAMNAANCLADMERLSDAVSLYGQVIEVFRTTKDERMEAATLLNLASSLERQGDAETACDEARLALVVFERLQDYQGVGECHLVLARADQDGSADEAKAAFKRIGDPVGEARALALADPAKGIGKLAELVGRGSADADILEQDAAWLAFRTGDFEEAARLLALASPSRQPALRTGSTSRTLRQLQSDVLTGSKEARRKLDELMASVRFEPGDFIPSDWSDLDEVRRRLRPDEAWYALCATGPGMIAIAVTSESVAATFTTADIDATLSGLHKPGSDKRLNKLADLMQPLASFPAVQRVYTLALGKLRDLPCEPVAQLAGLENISFSRIGASGQKDLPEFAETAKVHSGVRRNGESTLCGLPVVLGLSKFPGTTLPDLTGVNREVDAVGREWARPTKTATGQQATRKALLHSLKTAQWVHVATHAVPVFDRHPGSGLVLSDGKGNYEIVSGLELAQGTCNARLVVLSACATAPGGRTGTALSLAQALIQAGAGCVVASLWPVEDSAAALWMRGFYLALGQGGAVEDAMRQGARECREGGFDDPHYWAAWQLYGDFGVSFSLPL
ncbi:MAG: CHAT domain-containing protein [Fimbriimonadaceae bacterium]|nr:CHAT domain-containing protein [Fimbriimonadaceae bacterium]